MRLLSISNIAKPLRNIFSAAGSGVSELYGKMYIAEDLLYLFHVY
jgi:hypothetical protein